MNQILDALAQLPDGKTLIIGSDEQAEVVIASTKVDARHTQVARRGQSLLVRDLDSSSGTFVNGREVRGQAELLPGDRLRIGDLEITIPGLPPLDRHTAATIGVHGAQLAVVDAVKRVRVEGVGNRAILDQVSFQVCPGQFVGILGASGSGKSTLMKSVAGIVGLTSGTILLDGMPLSSATPTHQSLVAYLPQDVVIHEALTPAVALDYIAQLKELGNSETIRAGLVRDVLTRVGMTERANVPIQRLSGGQRKRVALAAELLGNPQLLLLDEATSGLDPATEADMMDLFRSLADEGRTVLCITHFPGRLHLCDRLVYLMQGRCVFDGTPEELKTFFGVENIEDAYRKQAERTPEEWEARYRSSSIKPSTATDMPTTIALQPTPTSSPPDFNAVAGQARILTSRYLRLQLADFRNLLLLIAQPPIISLMIASTFGSIKASFAELHAADTKLVAFVLVLAVLWCSGTLSVREIVRELPILRHERRFGVGTLAYLCSKMLLLGTFALIQAFLLLLLVRYFTNLTGPASGQLLVFASTALAGVSLGLLVSATAGTSERAMTILPVLLIAQAIFSGGLARLTGMVRWFSMIFVPAFWSLDGLKAQFSSDLANATYPGAPGHYQPPILGSGGPLSLDVMVLLAQSAALLAGVYFALNRSSRSVN
jgi:ABC-type multidrug transport system ATPase subunit